MTSGFLYDGANHVQELDGAASTAPVKAHLLTVGTDQVFTRLEGNDGANRQSVLTDANNSTVMLLDAAQNPTVHFAYEPYGSTTADTAHNHSQQYTGRENDNPGNPQGLYYYRARYYMPGIARPTSRQAWVEVVEGLARVTSERGLADGVSNDSGYGECQ